MEKKRCGLCRLTFTEAHWCRITNCPCTHQREPSEFAKQRYGWKYIGLYAPEGAHPLKALQ